MAWRGVTLASEGTTDVGGLASPYADWYETQNGFLQNMLSSCVPHHDLHFSDGRSPVLQVGIETSVSSAIEERAKRVGALASYNRSHVAIYVVDADNDTDPVRHRLEPIVRGLRAGVDSVPNGAEAIPVGGIAVRTIEAWVMGDAAAVAAAAGGRMTGAVPAHPETLWGSPHDPSSNHPKQALRRLFGGALDTADYAFVGEFLDPTVVAQRCPAGFAPFLQRVLAALH